MIQSVNNVNSGIFEQKKLEKACEEFEAFFYNAILKSARNTSLESDFIKKSEGEKTFTEMLDYEISKSAAKDSSGGIKDLLMDFFRENYSPDKGKKYLGNYNLKEENIKNVNKLLA